MKIAIVAGEASGDILGAGLIQALKQDNTELVVSGIGGLGMIAAGCQSLYEIERLSVMGLVEPLKRLPELFRIRKNLYQHFLKQKPDVFIGIDAPDFNLGLELKLKQQGIPVVHYVSPSVWAWRKKRIYKIAKATDLVLTLFPFEAAFYEENNVPACFVGHPLADMIPMQPDKSAARKRLGLSDDITYIALLPGSRRNEIRFLAPVFIQAAQECVKQNKDLCFITSSINHDRDLEFQAICKSIAPTLPITFFQGHSHDVMAAADVVLVASGTATLETLLFKKPMVIAYKMANLTYQIARHLVKIPYIGLPNLLANEPLVPEFIQDQVTPDNLALALLDYLAHPQKSLDLQEKFTRIHLTLRKDANIKAALAISTLIT
jgi:lipid-A-disaccharide synthase